MTAVRTKGVLATNCPAVDTATACMDVPFVKGKRDELAKPMSSASTTRTLWKATLLFTITEIAVWPSMRVSIQGLFQNALASRGPLYNTVCFFGLIVRTMTASSCPVGGFGELGLSFISHS